MSDAFAAPATNQERQAAFIASQVKDGESVLVGANMPLARAGLLLAHLSRCPNLRMQYSFFQGNFSDQQFLPDFSTFADPTAWQYSEYAGDFLWQWHQLRFLDLFFVGGLQVDWHGNCNLVGIGTDHSRLKVRGPGGVGSATLTSYASRYIIMLTSHSPRVLVEKCDFISAVGWHQGGDSARVDLGLPGGGPEWVITPMGVFDFAPGSRRMRLRMLQPGHSVADVQAQTGFPLLVAEEVGDLPDPDPGEIRLLRTRIDPDGLLRSSKER